MDGNGLKWMEMAKKYCNGQNDQNGQTDKNGQKWLKTAEKDPKSCKPQISMTPNLNNPKSQRPQISTTPNLDDPES